MLKAGTIVDKKNMLKEGIIVDKKTRKKKAINIQTGDDGHNAKKIMEILFQLLKMSKKEYKEQVKYYG